MIENLLDSTTKYLGIIDSDTDPIELKFPLKEDTVHFFFCKRGPAEFQFAPMYSRSLEEGAFFTIYDQERSLPLEIRSKGCAMVYMAMPPSYIHDQIIGNDKSFAHPSFKGFGVREYAVKTISFGTDMVLDSILQAKVPNLLKSVFYHGKVLELLSYTFDIEEAQLFEACPFLKEKENVDRINQARNILIEHMDTPPSLTELSKMIGMNEYNLKIGFKNVYGLPAFKYLQEYRLNYAKKLLSEEQLQVAEIADKIGYKSTSHFIEAFRKKYGSTPKKYMQALHA